MSPLVKPNDSGGRFRGILSKEWCEVSPGFGTATEQLSALAMQQREDEQSTREDLGL